MGRRNSGFVRAFSTVNPIKCPRVFTAWTSWDQAHSERVDRSYDYPHVVAADWVLYRLARNYEGLVTNHPWGWYLTNAYETSVAMVKFAPPYAVFGQMEGDIFLPVLRDLRREGWNSQADDLETKMRVQIAGRRKHIRLGVKCRGTRPAKRRFTPG